MEIDVIAASGARATGKLTAIVTGTPQLVISTTDGQLNASGVAGDTTTETILVTNTGTAPLDGVQFAATPPVAPGETTQVQALIRSDSGAVAGDYVITIRASSGTNSDQIELRYSVNTSGRVGVIAGIVIAAALAVLVTAYRRLGRR